MTLWQLLQEYANQKGGMNQSQLAEVLDFTEMDITRLKRKGYLGQEKNQAINTFLRKHLKPERRKYVQEAFRLAEAIRQDTRLSSFQEQTHLFALKKLEKYYQIEFDYDFKILDYGKLDELYERVVPKEFDDIHFRYSIAKMAKKSKKVSHLGRGKVFLSPRSGIGEILVWEIAIVIGIEEKKRTSLDAVMKPDVFRVRKMIKRDEKLEINKAHFNKCGNSLLKNLKINQLSFAEFVKRKIDENEELSLDGSTVKVETDFLTRVELFLLDMARVDFVTDESDIRKSAYYYHSELKERILKEAHKKMLLAHFFRHLINESISNSLFS